MIFAPHLTPGPPGPSPHPRVEQCHPQPPTQNSIQNLTVNLSRSRSAMTKRAPKVCCNLHRRASVEIAESWSAVAIPGSAPRGPTPPPRVRTSRQGSGGSTLRSLHSAGLVVGFERTCHAPCSSRPPVKLNTASPSGGARGAPATTSVGTPPRPPAGGCLAVNPWVGFSPLPPAGGLCGWPSDPD